MRTISFISANYVARANYYNGIEDWGAQDRATNAAANPDTFQAMARDVASAGFEAIDIWTAHCHWQHHSPAPSDPVGAGSPRPLSSDYLEQVKGICSN